MFQGFFRSLLLNSTHKEIVPYWIETKIEI